jgi:hypothetical protein
MISEVSGARRKRERERERERETCESFSCMEEVVESGISKKVFFSVKLFPEFQNSFFRELHKYLGYVCVYVVRLHATCMFEIKLAINALYSVV